MPIVILKHNMPQLTVRNVFYYMPLNWEETIPLVNLPKIHVFIEVYLTNHLS
jgi:hypothetical protein